MNCEGLVLKRPKILKIGSALNPKARSILPSGINAANPAPTQCIRPDTTSTTDTPKTTQKALRQRKGFFRSADSPLTVVHQYQTIKIRPTSNMIRGMDVYNSESKSLISGTNPSAIQRAIQSKNRIGNHLLFKTSLSLSAMPRILASVVSQSIHASVTETP